MWNLGFLYVDFESMLAFALSALIFGLIPIFDIITVCREVIATLKSLWMTFQEKKTS